MNRYSTQPERMTSVAEGKQNMAKTKQQANLWQTLGFVAFIGGAALLARLFIVRSHVNTTTSPILGAVIAVTFIMLTGFALFAVGRLLNSYCQGYGKAESIAWKSTGVLMLLTGMAAMVLQNMS